MNATLKAKVLALRQQMEAVVIEAAEQAAKQVCDFGFQTSYADNYWTIYVHPDGTVTNDGYAEEIHGPTRHVTQLSTWELGRLLEEIETGNFASRQKALSRPSSRRR